MNLVTRRDFLATAAAGLAMGRGVFAAQEAGGVPRRPMGRHRDVMLPMIALGGWDIGRPPEAEAVAIMHEAIDQGLTFFDNCWEYHKGRSEEFMGKALAGGRRDKVFLMTKVCGRTYEDAKRHLDESLRRLQTDRLDLWMFHGIRWDEDPGLIFDPENGAARAAVEARKAGKIRHIGFTGHKDPKFHLAMLERTAAKDAPFEFDAVLMPLNILDPHYFSFQKEVLPVLVKRGIAPLGMKSLGAQDGRIPRETGVPATECRRYALSLPVTSLVCGIMSMDNLRQDLGVARTFQPMTEAEVAALVARAEPFAKNGRIEAYKTGDYGCSVHRRKAAS